MCIKIVVVGDDAESQREQKYYSFLKNRNISWEVLPKFHGVVDTNLGCGAVFDLIRDCDGSISKNLEYYLNSNKETELHYSGLSKAINFLKYKLYEQKIITMNLKPKNIMYKKINKKESRLVIIDNIGNSDFIPICNYIGFFSREKILRKWQRFECSMLKDYAQNKILHRMLKNLDSS